MHHHNFNIWGLNSKNYVFVCLWNYREHLVTPRIRGLTINQFLGRIVSIFANRQRRRSTPKTQKMKNTCPDMDNILALTETEFFKKLRHGLHDETLHVALRDFILRVHEVTHPSSPHRFYALEALLIADIELSQFKSSESLALANESLSAAIVRAHEYVLMKLHEHRNILGFKPRENGTEIDGTLNWSFDKTKFSMLCIALKVGKCFGNCSLDKIVKRLGKAFNVKISAQYVRNRVQSFSQRNQDYSPTDFIEYLLNGLRNFMLGERDDEKTA